MVRFAVGLLTPVIALACPLCHSSTGTAVRANLLYQDLGWRSSAVALPFICFVLIVRWLAGSRDTDGSSIL